MALTAWEIHGEKRVGEAVRARLRALEGSAIGMLATAKLAAGPKPFHDPNSDKKPQVSSDCLEIDANLLPLILCAPSRAVSGLLLQTHQSP